jgi:hypothetical protein
MTLPLILFFLAAFGLSFVLGFSKLSLPFREALAKAGPIGVFFVTLVECPGCLGFWEGVAGWFWRGAFDLPLSGSLLLGLVFALAVCGSNMVLGRYVGMVRE